MKSNMCNERVRCVQFRWCVGFPGGVVLGKNLVEWLMVAYSDESYTLLLLGRGKGVDPFSWVIGLLDGGL